MTASRRLLSILATGEFVPVFRTSRDPRPAVRAIWRTPCLARLEQRR